MSALMSQNEGLMQKRMPNRRHRKLKGDDDSCGFTGSPHLHSGSVAIIIDALPGLAPLRRLRRMAHEKRIAVYPGVFDPVHFGHLDVIQRGSKLVDRLIVAVGENPEKAPLFDQEERVELIKKCVKDYANVE